MEVDVWTAENHRKRLPTLSANVRGIRARPVQSETESWVMLTPSEVRDYKIAADRCCIWENTFAPDTAYQDLFQPRQPPYNPPHRVIVYRRQTRKDSGEPSLRLSSAKVCKRIHGYIDGWRLVRPAELRKRVIASTANLCQRYIPLKNRSAIPAFENVPFIWGSRIGRSAS